MSGETQQPLSVSHSLRQSVERVLDLSLTTTSGRPTSSTVRGAAGGFCGRLYGMICPRRGAPVVAEG